MAIFITFLSIIVFIGGIFFGSTQFYLAAIWLLLLAIAVKLDKALPGERK